VYVFCGPCSCFCPVNSDFIIITLIFVCLENDLVGEIVITVQVVKCVAWNFFVVIFHYVINQVLYMCYTFVVCGELCIVFDTV